MKKGIFKELVYLKINGGQLNDSPAVDRRDINAYIPAAVNYVMTAGRNIAIQQEGLRDYSSLFYGYFPNLTIGTDIDRHNWKYITRPKGTPALPKNEGFRAVEDGCGGSLKILSDNAFRTIVHYAKILTGASYFRPEGDKIYLFNLNPLAEHINLSMIVDANDLTDDDELPIPAGLEAMAIDKCYEFISGQRQVPADRKSDERDIN